MVFILDSTLREGEQTPGVTFTIPEKLEISSILDELGVDLIEAGHPAVSDQIKESVREISKLSLNAEVLAHSRACKHDIDQVIDCDVGWIGIFISVLENRLKKDFKKDLSTVIDMVVDSVEYAKDHGLRVRYTPEDTIRSDRASVFNVTKAAMNAGADRISVADTVGAATPEMMGSFVRDLIDSTKARVNVHCHNDLGLALANSLSAFREGAITIDACVNGLGERAGITALSSLRVALEVHYK
jgi:2-isopropylmalate synthase